jgi:hypothetical protein
MQPGFVVEFKAIKYESYRLLAKNEQVPNFHVQNKYYNMYHPH